jgi:predicted naringenin-chalcone synthase
MLAGQATALGTHGAHLVDGRVVPGGRDQGIMTERSAVITASASAVPPSRSQEALWTDFLGPHLSHNRWAQRIYASVGVRQRHPAVDPTKEDISEWSTGRRMQRYVPEALPLGKSAVADALASAGLDSSEVGLFAVASCTGYATPGIDIRLARDLAMADTVQRLLIGHMGCYAAIPGLGAVSDFVVARQRPAVLLCLELCSLHVQPAILEPEQIVAHALFSDAAAAVVVTPGEAAGLSIVDVAALSDPSSAGYMTWDVTDQGFRMGLSRRVPEVLAVHIAPLIGGLLERNGITSQQVSRWAVHPGGPRILDVVEQRLALAPDALAESRQVLAEHGNCSSATSLLVIEDIQRRRPAPKGTYIVVVSFGPGLTLYAALLRAV